MNQGFLAHRICYKDQIYRKHILFLNGNNQVTGVEPFFNETANTTFYDGILLVTSSTFHLHLNEFISALKEQLENPAITLSQAILENRVYNSYIPDIQDSCSLYNIPEICWENERPVSAGIEIGIILH